MKKYLSLLSTKTKIKCVGIIALTMLGSIASSIWPVKLGDLYNEISNGTITTVSHGITAVACFGLVFLAAECISIIRRVLLDCIIATHEAEVREGSIQKLLKMPIAYCTEKASAERTAQLNQGVSGLSQLIKISCNDILSTAMVAVCTIYQVITNAPAIMAAIMIGYLVLIISISVFQIRSQNGIREKIISLKNSLDGQIGQSITNLELIRSMNAGEYEKDRLKPSIVKISSTEKKHHRYMGGFDCIKQVCKIAFHIIILLTSVVMITSNKMSPASVITVCLLFQQLVKPIDEVYRFMDETASSVVKAKVLTEVAAKGLDPVFSIQSNTTNNSDTNILIKDVVITDPTGEKILAGYDNLTLPGATIAAVQGESGCGKTTLMRCLTRYYPYISGDITLFGNKLHSYSQQELTDILFYLPQKSFFFAGSIRDNLAYGISRKVSDEELISALRNVCLYDILVAKVREENPNEISNTLTSVLDYCVGEGGSGLSGGEGQRLSLARAFLRKPKMFIFDESTTGLDSATAQKVLNRIEEYAASIHAGIIYISHDERVINRCKYIIKLINRFKENQDGQAA